MRMFTCHGSGPKHNYRHTALSMISYFYSQGGGSALLPLPCPPITLEEEAALTKTLSQNGATINDMNTIRKHIEELKGGGLAKAAFPAQVRSEMDGIF